MEERRLNPHAPPFYPSKTVKNTPPLLLPPTKWKSSVRFPVPFRPRNRKPRVPHRKTPPPPPQRPPHPGGRSFNGGVDGRRKYQVITPLDPNENATSVMIRNIPSNYTRLLVELLEKHCKKENEKDDSVVRSAFDFVYLPVDFEHRLNAGYAFVNFTTSQAAWKFHQSFTGKSWDLFESKKIADVTRARIQGKEALVLNFERMKLRSPSWEYLPVWFEPSRDGCTTPSKMHVIGHHQCHMLPK